MPDASPTPFPLPRVKLTCDTESRGHHVKAGKLEIEGNQAHKHSLSIGRLKPLLHAPRPVDDLIPIDDLTNTRA